MNDYVEKHEVDIQHLSYFKVWLSQMTYNCSFSLSQIFPLFSDEKNNEDGEEASTQEFGTKNGQPQTESAESKTEVEHSLTCHY